MQPLLNSVKETNAVIKMTELKHSSLFFFYFFKDFIQLNCSALPCSIQEYNQHKIHVDNCLAKQFAVYQNHLNKLDNSDHLKIKLYNLGSL